MTSPAQLSGTKESSHVTHQSTTRSERISLHLKTKLIEPLRAVSLFHLFRFNKVKRNKADGNIIMKNIIIRDPLLSREYHHECSPTFNKAKENVIMPLLSLHEISRLTSAYISKEALMKKEHKKILSTSLFCNLLLMC